ncbi:hypothetical protein T069G_00431 [Trichoderma breve]|uniref:Uncharacterized protein n=1 Tax=Trichoderma breve TaxID=2034170 RepID=A0A9W9EC15_9HYPO|nr:hypothetical protein T069G_00431 [Trichoderma breve]KAJ4863901.1 hypothetical protein T069G_00431 [Trichoderma breve]
MRIRDFGRSVRDHITTSWTRLGRNRDTTQQDLESGSRENLFSRLELSRREIMIRRAIRQETPPRPTYLLHDPTSFSPVEGVRVRRTVSSEFRHHQLTIRAQEEFTPPGSPTGTTLGIPAEHLLYDDQQEMGDIIQALPPNFDNPFVRPRRSLADSDESSETRSDDSIQSSFPNVATPVTQPGSPMGDSPASLVVRPPGPGQGIEHLGNVLVYVLQLLALLEVAIWNAAGHGDVPISPPSEGEASDADDAVGDAVSPGGRVLGYCVDGQILAVSGAVAAPAGHDDEGEEEEEDERDDGGDDEYLWFCGTRRGDRADPYLAMEQSKLNALYKGRIFKIRADDSGMAMAETQFQNDGFDMEF